MRSSSKPDQFAQCLVPFSVTDQQTIYPICAKLVQTNFLQQNGKLF